MAEAAVVVEKGITPVQRWAGEIDLARKREKDYRKDGKRVLAIYSGEKKDETPFNILYSNTETLAPALFSQTPRPVVQRRFKDEDPLGKVSSQAGQRALEYLLDTNSEEYSSFPSVMEDAVLDALLPGRGCSIIKYDSKVQEVPDPSDPEGKRTTPVMLYETICFESVEWDRIIFGYARKWCKVPWMAIEYYVDRQEATELFTKEIADKLQYIEGDGSSEDNEKKDEGEKKDERKVCLIYKIWDKDGGKKIRFLAPCYQDDFLKVEDDQLHLTNFFPMPEPLRLLKKANDQSPTSIYLLYENQHKELNTITVRINRVVEALKVRGVYDSQLGDDIEKIFEEDDNKMVPAENVAALNQAGGLEKSIWLVPIDKLIMVLQQLIVARQQCKQIIFEITGIADIIRGSSVASETATAQTIKDKWSTLRLKKQQQQVSRFVRDLLRLTLELAAKKLSERTWAGMTGMQEVISSTKKKMAQQIMMAAQQAGQMPDPQTAAAAQAPSWEEVLKLLKDDMSRQYRIDIETNSTVDPDATEDQKNIQEALGAMNTTLQGLTPLVQSGVMPFQSAQMLLLAVTRRFRFGTEIEDIIKSMQPPQPQDDGKAKAEQAKAQAEAQKQQAESQREQERFKLEMQQKNADFQMQQTDRAQEAAFKQREHQFKMAELDRKERFAEKQLALKLAGLEAQVAAANAMPKKDAKGDKRAPS